MSTLSDVLPRASALPRATDLCRHCGEACGAGITDARGHVFCCAGCAAVFALIAEHRMTAFYACAPRPGVSQKSASTLDAERFAPLDDPAVARRFAVAAGPGRSRVTFPVPAMHCASCLWLLEQLWRFRDGIVRSEANLLRRTVTVEFDPGAVSLRGVAEQLAALGYEPVIDHEPAAAVPHARRRLYLQIGVAGFAFGNVMLFSIPRYANGAPLEPSFQRLFGALNIAFALPVLLYSARDYFLSAARAARARTITLDVPVALGLMVLFARSVLEIASGAGEGFLDSFSGLVFFLLIGKLFQQKAFEQLAFDRTMRSFLPLSARVIRAAGVELTPIERLRPGDTIVLRPREVVPADAVLISDAGAVDYAFVTGEAAPVTIRRGDMVHAGGRVTGHAIQLTVSRAVSHSALADLWSHPVFDAPKTHWLTGLLATFGKWFTVAAIALAAVGAALWWGDGRKAAEVATAVLIIACPCAFTLAAPITLGTAMGVLGRAGLYLKGPESALDLSRIDTIAVDKTGTLTSGAAEAAATHGGFTDAEWLLVRRLAAQSVHPMSRAIAGDLAGGGDAVSDVAEIAGRGVRGTVDGHRVVLGSASFVGARVPADGPSDLAAWASVDGGAPGWIRLVAPERPGVADAFAALASRAGLWLLSGDRPADAPRWRGIFGDRMRFRQTPGDKLAAIRALQDAGRRVLMVGDGLNDAGALAAADVGIAVSDDTACLVPACDAVIRGDRLRRLETFIGYAARARRVIVLCFAVSMAYNAIGLGLALAGRLTPLATAILMPISSLTIVGLSAGLMRARIRRVLA